MSGPNTVIQYSFATGIVSPGVRNRRDWERIDGAVSDLVNGTVGPTGGARKRPGTRLVNEALHDDKPIRLVEFEFSQDQTYQLEFGDETMRFYIDRAPILDANGNVYRIDTPYTAQQAQEFTFAQNLDAMFFAHWDKPVKRLTRYGHANWVWDDVFRESDEIRPPKTVTFYTDATNGHTGHEYAVTSYVIESGAYTESIGDYSIVASRTDDIDSISQVPQNNIDSCINWIKTYRAKYGHLAGFPTYPEAFADVSSIAEDGSPVTYLHPKLVPIYKAKYPNLTQARQYRLTEPFFIPGIGMEYHYNFYWGLGDSGGNTIVQWRYGWMRTTSDYIFSNLHITGEAPVSGKVASFTYTWFMRDQAMGWINSNQVSINGQTMSGIYNAIMSFINTYNQNNSQKIYNRIKWTPVAKAVGYLVYRRTIGAEDKSFRQVADVRDALDFNDENVEETEVGTKSPILGKNTFDSPDKYPRLVTFFQQRLVLGSTKEKPTTIFGGSTGSTGGIDPTTGKYVPPKFTIDPTDPSSGYEFKMASQQSNPLSAILPLYTLVCLTSGGDFISTVAGAMNASNVNFNQKSYNGASKVPPIILGDSGLYVPLGQQTINSIAYSYEKDGFAHDNILFQAQALAKDKRIIGLSYQRDPINLIWAVLDDGTLLSCTYIPGQSFLAWTRHETRGAVLSINTVTSSTGNDEIWMVVRRTLGDGTEKQYLEVLEDMRPYGGTPTAETAFYVDSGLSAIYAQPRTDIPGLEHLEGLEVAILADFNVEERQTVRNGSITLSQPATAVHVGLPYEFHLKTINFELLNQGTLRNTRRAVYRVFPEVEDTRELLCSLNGGEAYPLIVHQADEFGVPQLKNGDIPPFTLKARETNGAWAEFSSVDPLPCSVLSLVAEVTHGDS